MEHLAAHDTQLYADCVAWCPHHELHHVLAFGTYQLCGAERKGGLHFASTTGISESGANLEPATSFELPGVLDLQWGQEAGLAAITLADGSVRLFRCDGDAGAIAIATTDAAGTDTVLMALDWADKDVLACGIDGRIYHWKLQDSAFTLASSWHGHDLEAWMVRSDPSQPDTVWSGSDDGLLRRWDRRAPGEALSSSVHEAGVVSIEFDPGDPMALLSGSYDETLRIWDVRAMRRPVHASAKYGDGVWRLRWLPGRRDTLLVAGMRSGVHIVDVHRPSAEEWHTEQVGHYSQHEALCAAPGGVESFLAYGADWCHAEGDAGARLGASVSFYDHSLHVWQATASPAVLL